MSASTLRKSLWPLGSVYRCAMALRNRGYDRGWLASERLEVPVVSVGNLTVGGTGKTPCVVWWLERALAAGHRPGVLARGYGRAKGAELNDEGLLLAARFPGLPQVQDPDRVRGGRRLIAEHGVDRIVVDDGFQHRRLRRDVDLVCLDARRPFAQGLVMPAGDLREGARAALGRADLLVLTRVDRLRPADVSTDPAELTPWIDARKAQLREFARRDLPMFAASHAPRRVVRLQGGGSVALADLRGARVLPVAAIADPDSFAATLRQLGAEVLEPVRFRDHHRYSSDDARALAARATQSGAALITTEKDAVKLRSFTLDAMVLEIDLRWHGAAPGLAEVGLA